MGSPGSDQLPVLFEMTVWVTLVALFLTTTVAPGMTPPPLSTTIPDSAEDPEPCAYAGEAAINRHTTIHTSLCRPCFIPVFLQAQRFAGGLTAGGTAIGTRRPRSLNTVREWD